MPPPDRWEKYSPLGKVIPDTKFLAFKVPLKEAMLTKVAEEDKFSPSILVEKLQEQDLALAGVIDLTFTRKYYNKEEFETKSITHKKVFTKGHEVPSDDVFKEFLEAVESFDKNRDLIGVHCTHGVNRTGYLICRYMIEKLDKEPQDAIDSFNNARGHEIERENYLADLKERKRGTVTWGLISQAEPDGELSSKKKPRWRHHKEDHPNWRKSAPSHSDERDRFHFPDHFQRRNFHHEFNDSRRDFRGSQTFQRDGHCTRDFPTQGNYRQNSNHRDQRHYRSNYGQPQHHNRYSDSHNYVRGDGYHSHSSFHRDRGANLTYRYNEWHQGRTSARPERFSSEHHIRRRNDRPF